MWFARCKDKKLFLINNTHSKVLPERVVFPFKFSCVSTGLKILSQVSRPVAGTCVVGLPFRTVTTLRTITDLHTRNLKSSLPNLECDFANLIQGAGWI
jgi:hypothetical protein